MAIRRITTLGMLAVLVVVVIAGESQAGGAFPITSCGQTVTTNAILTQNLTCTGDGIIVGAPKITIDLGGFSMRGDASGSDDGINDASGHDFVTVKNGVIRNFNVAIFGSGGADALSVVNVVTANNGYGIFVNGDHLSVKSTTATFNSIFGIVVSGAAPSIKSSTVVGNGGLGVNLTGTSASVSTSTLSGNGGQGLFATGDLVSVKSVNASGNGLAGINVVGGKATISSSTASGNRRQGILVTGDAPVFKGNRAEGNGYAVADLADAGIHALGFTTPPTGKNIARGNDDPLECIPALLC